MTRISTHVLDTTAGAPATGVALHLEAFANDAWGRIGFGVTDNDGRVEQIGDVGPGIYKLVFDTATYFTSDTFYPAVEIVFRVNDTSDHLHVPLLLSPFGYTTYRGS